MEILDFHFTKMKNYMEMQKSLRYLSDLYFALHWSKHHSFTFSQAQTPHSFIEYIYRTNYKIKEKQGLFDLLVHISEINKCVFLMNQKVHENVSLTFYSNIQHKVEEYHLWAVDYHWKKLNAEVAFSYHDKDTETRQLQFEVNFPLFADWI